MYATQDSGIREWEIVEYETLELKRGELEWELGKALWKQYGAKVTVEFPSPKTDGCWQLTPQGWVGHIALPGGLRLHLQPKVELGNLFRMLEYAYELDLHIEEDLIACESLTEFYERLAHVLAKRVLSRGKRGYYRAYVSESERLPYVRGQLDVRRLAARPWEAHLRCHYEEHTGDVAENQLLTWTLYRIVRSGLCGKRVLPTIRKAYRTMQSFTALEPFNPQACVGRLYNRLNDDYEPLHALCRFFLEHSGPGQATGEHAMLPFLIDMSRLFEMFVARWLKQHLPPNLRLKVQENVDITAGGGLRFRIDLVLYDRASNTPLCVLDTKYKRPTTPAESDIHQITSYAASRHCYEGVLIYPVNLAVPVDTHVGEFRVRSAVFALDGDLDAAGHALMDELVGHEGGAVPMEA